MNSFLKITLIILFLTACIQVRNADPDSPDSSSADDPGCGCEEETSDSPPTEGDTDKEGEPGIPIIDGETDGDEGCDTPDTPQVPYPYPYTVYRDGIPGKDLPGSPPYNDGVGKSGPVIKLNFNFRVNIPSGKTYGERGTDTIITEGETDGGGVPDLPTKDVYRDRIPGRDSPGSPPYNGQTDGGESKTRITKDIIERIIEKVGKEGSDSPGKGGEADGGGSDMPSTEDPGCGCEEVIPDAPALKGETEGEGGTEGGKKKK